jgi:hypothetical protein
MNENATAVSRSIHGLSRQPTVGRTAHDGARVIHVIDTNLTSRGEGTPDDPCRRVRRIFSVDGRLIAEVDPFDANEYELRQLGEYILSRGYVRLSDRMTPARAAIELLEADIARRKEESVAKADAVLREVAKRPPLQALLISPNQTERRGIATGKITATIRNGTRNYQLGPVLIGCHLKPWAVMADIGAVAHCSLHKALNCPPELFNEFGYKSAPDAIKKLQRFYPGINSESPVTVISWGNVRGALVPTETVETRIGGRRRRRALTTC